VPREGRLTFSPLHDVLVVEEVRILAEGRAADVGHALAEDEAP
jgi:hypothetical protein